MELDIVIDDSLYHSDSIYNGRTAKKFFLQLCNGIFQNAFEYYNQINKLTNEHELSLLYEESNLYSLIGASIHNITPVHLSEWCFGKNYDLRTVDFYCTHKGSTSSNPINYFIEVKKGKYCLNKNSLDDLTQKTKYNIDVLVGQISDIKNFKPSDTRWFDFDNIYMGLSIMHGYYSDGQDLFSEKDVIARTNDCIDKRKGIQLITSTWNLPQTMDIDKDGYRYKFVSITGLILSKQK